MNDYEINLDVTTTTHHINQISQGINVDYVEGNASVNNYNINIDLQTNNPTVNNTSDDISIDQVSNEIVLEAGNKITIYQDGTKIGSAKSIDFKAGSNITLSSSKVGNRIEITITSTATGGGGGGSWGSITGTLSDQTDLQAALNAKQATLVSGTNIKTINGSSVLGSGDLTVSGGAGTPGGSDTQVQFNDSSAFGGDAGFTYNKTTDVLTVAGDVIIGTSKAQTLSNYTNSFLLMGG